MIQNKNLSVGQMRQNYQRAHLRKTDLLASPISQFTHWLGEAVEKNMLEPNAMALATASPQGKPSCRMVLLKGYSEGGFLFFTNLGSRKACELKENPLAMAVFFWDILERQVSIEGQIEPLDRGEVQAYFATRPRGSQLACWASQQGKILSSYGELEAAFSEAFERYHDQSIPLPSFWGGYRLVPVRFEFWQGGKDRLHDRFQYVLEEQKTWKIERLAP